MDNNLRLLGIAKKAGLLAIGADSVSIAARDRKARLILSASDAGDSAKRHAAGYAERGGAIHLELTYTRFELGAVVGRGQPGTLAVLDTGIAAKLAQNLAAAEPERYGEQAKLLTSSADRMLRRKKEAAANKKINSTGKRRTAK